MSIKKARFGQQFGLDARGLQLSRPAYGGAQAA